jgi:hypothetical protein
MISDTGILTSDDNASAVSLRAILAGSTASIAITLLLFALGIGLGFSVISPWSDSGISATTFTISAGLYFIVVAMLSSTIGGYIAGRLRSRWQTVHEHERYFRDSAHGFLVWALATVVGATILGAATTHLLAGAGAGLAPAAGMAAQSAPTDIYVDRLLRAGPQQPSQNTPASAAAATTNPTAESQTAAPLQGGQASAAQGQPRVERASISRILAPAMVKGGNVSDADKSYLVSVVAARQGVSQQQAEQEVNQDINDMKSAADTARKSTAAFALWLVVSMLAGALSASLAAIEGGNLRNREWYLTPAERGRTRVDMAPAE